MSRSVFRRASGILLLLALVPVRAPMAEERPRRAVPPAAVEQGGFLAVLYDLFAGWRDLLEKGGGSMEPDGGKDPKPETTTDGGGSMDPNGRC